MKRKLDLDKIASGLGGERRGSVHAGGGHFGALTLVAEVNDRFRVPEKGGRATDPTWTERRQVPLRPQTLKRLERLAASIGKTSGTEVHPMQLAGLLLEKVTDEVDDEEAAGMVAKRTGLPA